jgi:hypothetical protein
MVRVLLFVFLIFTGSLSADIQVSAQVLDTPPTNEGLLTGLIRIRQTIDTNVDLNSFTLQGKPLQVQFLGFDQVSNPMEKQTTSNEVIAKYQFFVKAEKGMQILPPISVRINGKEYTTTSVSYQVTQLSSSKSILKLEVEIQSEQPFYVGQRASFIYRIYYNENVDLTKEDLPLLEPKGFLKVGPLMVKSYNKDNFDVNELTQEVQSTAAGTYKFPPSVIEGKAYKTVYGNQKIYMEPPLRGEVPEVTITVASFAEPEKPASFTGAIGQYTMTTQSLSPNKVFVGDSIVLQITVTGSGLFESLTLPDLSCQPGFSGFFDINPIPLSVNTEANAKKFRIGIRPLTTLIKQLPAVEFSYFDADKKEYKTLRSPPIPISVEQPPQYIQSAPSNAIKEIPSTNWEAVYGKLIPVDISPITHVPSLDFVSRALNIWTVLASILFGSGLLLLLKKYKPLLERKRPVNVQEMLLVAKRNSNNPPVCLEILEKALSAAHDQGLISPENEKAYQELRSRIDDARYGGKEGVVLDELIDTASKIIEKRP